MVTERLLINCSAVYTLPVFRAGSCRAIPDMTGRFLDLAASGALLVLGAGSGRHIPFMARCLL